MNTRPCRAILCVSLLLLASCTKPKGQPQVATTGTASDARRAAPEDPNPSLTIESRQELSFTTGANAILWSLRGRKVKELTARLLIATDGKANKENEISCRWDDTSKPVHGNLVLLIQDGAPFGMKGKRLPSLTLSFVSGEPNARAAKYLPRLVPSVEGSSMSTARNDGAVAQTDILHASYIAGKKEGTRSFNLGTEAGLVEASKDGGLALAVLVEWK